MSRLLLALCVLVFSGLASAEQGDLVIQTRTVAYHSGSTKHNNIVPAIGVEYEVLDRVKVGYFYGRNSILSEHALHKYSHFLQAQYIVYRDPKWDVGLMASVGNGYETRRFKDDRRESVAIQTCYKTDVKIHTCAHYTPWSDSPIKTQTLGFIIKFVVN